MSSPRMNNIIVVGAILIYAAGILRGIDGNFVSPGVEAIFRCKVSVGNDTEVLIPVKTGYTGKMENASFNVKLSYIVKSTYEL